VRGETGTWALAQVSARRQARSSGQGRKVRAPEVPCGFWCKLRVGAAQAVLEWRGPEVPGWPEGPGAGGSGLWPKGPGLAEILHKS